MSLHLLLVEDKPTTREQLLQFLAQTPFTVSCANDGLEGLNRCKTESFDVVLVDHKMPLMDGLALIKSLRQLPAYRAVPIILMTTLDSAQVDPLAEKAGASLCLSKPIDGARLIELLDDLARTIAQPQQSTA